MLFAMENMILIYYSKDFSIQNAPRFRPIQISKHFNIFDYQNDKKIYNRTENMMEKKTATKTEFWRNSVLSQMKKKNITNRCIV